MVDQTSTGLADCIPTNAWVFLFQNPTFDTMLRQLKGKVHDASLPGAFLITKHTQINRVAGAAHFLHIILKSKIVCDDQCCGAGAGLFCWSRRR